MNPSIDGRLSGIAAIIAYDALYAFGLFVYARKSAPVNFSFFASIVAAMSLRVFPTFTPTTVVGVATPLTSLSMMSSGFSLPTSVYVPACRLSSLSFSLR